MLIQATFPCHPIKMKITLDLKKKKKATKDKQQDKKTPIITCMFMNQHECKMDRMKNIG